mmetsp:Transcript_52467/g.145474  ORF Transcript_52467/g.145474 Transcript_52467/m.145474 type:complete len:124 (-) Transcript_52467:109-480(-)
MVLRKRRLRLEFRAEHFTATTFQEARQGSSRVIKRPCLFPPSRIVVIPCLELRVRVSLTVASNPEAGIERFKDSFETAPKGAFHSQMDKSPISGVNLTAAPTNLKMRNLSKRVAQGNLRGSHD